MASQSHSIGSFRDYSWDDDAPLLCRSNAACLPAHPHLQRPRVEVIRSGIEPVVPKVGDVVTARVVRINPRLAAGTWVGGLAD